VNIPGRFLVFFLSCLFGFETAWAKKITAPSTQKIKTSVDEYMKAAVEIERFTGSILIARDGKPLVSKSYGMANVELDAPNTADTVFRIASLTKQFTSAAIMMLQERGKLNVDDAACQYLADCPEAWRPITIRHLLTMTSGIQGITALEAGPLRGLPVPWDQWTQATQKKPLEFTPGEKFSYSNSGYTVLGFIIERVSGKSYGDFLHEEIFAPLDMTQTGYEDPLRVIKNRATGYRQLPGEPIANVPYEELFRLYAAGGVYSTTKDLWLWDQALYKKKILSKESLDEMFTPFRDMYPGKGYAYGWWTSSKNGRREIAHGGNLAGFITYFARFPDERVTVIVLSNNGRGSSGKISDTLSSIVFGAEYEIPKERKAVSVAIPVLENYVGEYQAQFPPTNYTIAIENGKLMFEEIDFVKAEMFAESETDFFLKTADMQIKFIKDANGTVTGFAVHQGDGTLYEVVNAQMIK
jgi:CubicO group peptidase (beta-lactamase class C family)